MKLATFDTVKCQKDFGQFVMEARTQRGYTQTEFAEILGVSQSYYSYLELGKRNIDLAFAVKVCKALDVDMREFIEQYYM